MDAFTWHDGERVIRFGRGTAGEALALAGGGGFALLTTERASSAIPELAEAAAEVHLVPGGLVDELAGELLARVAAEHVVALGGGRVVDVAKAVVAARRAGGEPYARTMAIPTTLSGAEMTVVHRTARGAPAETVNVRPAIVLNDPEISASQPEAGLAASALNALAHAVEGARTTRSHPVARLIAGEAERLLDRGFAAHGGLERDAVALGSLLAGAVIDSTGYGIHHVMAQTLARVGGAAHGHANAVLLPHTIRRLGAHEATGTARRILERTGLRGIRDVGVPRERLPDCAEAAADRAQLDLTPPRAGRAELLEIYQRAW
jgi:alcohol dehydrogenase class IV